MQLGVQRLKSAFNRLAKQLSGTGRQNARPKSRTASRPLSSYMTSNATASASAAVKQIGQRASSAKAAATLVMAGSGEPAMVIAVDVCHRWSNEIIRYDRMIYVAGGVFLQPFRPSQVYTHHLSFFVFLN